jgi:hypothetical protein
VIVEHLISVEEYEERFGAEDDAVQSIGDTQCRNSYYYKREGVRVGELIYKEKQTRTTLKESTYNAYTKLGITDDELSKLIKAKGDEKADTLDNLNSLKDLDIEKRRLYAASLYSLSKESREKVKRYVLDLDISKEEKINILKELKGFTVNTEKGTVKLN